EVEQASISEDDEQYNNVEVGTPKKIENFVALEASNIAMKWTVDNLFNSHELRQLRKRDFEMK
ncbi:hypothetical protein HHI36_010037, partial [Cryptolaemus montrouzieri]